MKTGILIKNRESGGFFLSNQRTYQSLQESERGDPTKIRLQGGAAERRRALNRSEQQLQTCEENRNSLREMFAADLCSGRVKGPKTQSSGLRRAENETRE